MDDAHPLWGWLSNYEPFELKTTPEETLFSLEREDTMLQE